MSLGCFQRFLLNSISKKEYSFSPIPIPSPTQNFPPTISPTLLPLYPTITYFTHFLPTTTSLFILSLSRGDRGNPRRRRTGLRCRCSLALADPSDGGIKSWATRSTLAGPCPLSSSVRRRVPCNKQTDPRRLLSVAQAGGRCCCDLLRVSSKGVAGRRRGRTC